MSYYLEDEKKLGQLKVIKELVAEHDLHSEACPLMLSQLYSLKVLTDKMAALTRDMIARTKERM